MAKRGRPKKVVVEGVTIMPKKYTREFPHKDGSKSVWKFDMSKNKFGPIEVEIVYPKGAKSEIEVQEELPKTKRKYLNPKNGKMVAYMRAKQLGIV